LWRIVTSDTFPAGEQPLMLTFLEIPVGPKKIVASLHLPASGGPAPLVICCHGLTGTRVGTAYRLVALGRRLEAQGIACLRFDFRGCGESDGRFEDVTSDSLLEDLLAVASHAGRIEGADASRLAIVASSFGAYTASRAAERLDALKCLVFLAPVADPLAVIRRDMTEPAWAFLRKHGWIEHFGLRMGAAFIDTLPAEDMPARLARAGRPVLIFHGTGDRHIPIEQGRAYEWAVRSAGGVAEFVPIESSDHGMKTVAGTAEILERSVGWLKRSLAR